MKRVVWLLPLCVACAGAAGPSEGVDLAEHREGFETLCHAEVRSGAIATFPFAAKAQTINAWLDKELNDAYVGTLYREKMPLEAIAYQGEMLRRRAAAAGVAHCSMADLVDFLGQLSSVTNGIDDCQKACVERHSENSEVKDLESQCTRGCGG